MLRTFATTLLVVGGLMGSASAMAAPVNYTLDAGQGALYVLVKYDRNSTIAGHDHVVQATQYTGTVTWDAESVGACKVHIEFPITALEVDPGNSRSREGLEGSTSDGDKRKIKSNLAGKYQLEADKFPKISFDSTSCTGSGSTVSVTGNLSMHGISKPVTANMNVTADAGSFRAKGSFKSTHRNWGFDPFSALLGALRNDDELKFVVDVVGRP